MCAEPVTNGISVLIPFRRTIDDAVDAVEDNIM
jgi:hypothetical protein